MVTYAQSGVQATARQGARGGGTQDAVAIIEQGVNALQFRVAPKFWSKEFAPVYGRSLSLEISRVSTFYTGRHIEELLPLLSFADQ